MSIYAFKLNVAHNSQPLQQILNTILNTPLDHRTRDVGAKVRVEDISFDANRNVWLMDFGKFRSNHGPGKASTRTPVVGFNFQQGEKFLEETACLYDQTNGYFIVQFNQSGVRHGKIAGYLSTFSQSQTNFYELLPVVDQNAQATLRNRTGIKRFVLKIAPRNFTEADRRSGASLKKALAMANTSGSENILIQMSSGLKKASRLSGFVDTLLNEAHQLFIRNPDAVEKLEASVVTTSDTVEVIDMISHRLKDVVPINPGADLRFPRQQRYNALLRAYSSWNPSY